MTATLDSFLGSTAKPAPQETRCAGCRTIIKGLKYEITRKGKTSSYCQTCAKQILRPGEDTKADL